MTLATARIAVARKEDVQLVHVIDPNSGSRPEAKRRLEQETERLRETRAVVEPVLIENRSVVDGLLAHIRAEPPSLVIVSVGPKGSLDRWMSGSVSEQVAESSPAPTLVMRNPAVFAEWGWTTKPLRILLALDLYSTSDAVLRWAKEFRGAGPCDLVACHVNWRMPVQPEIVTTFKPLMNPPQIQHRLEGVLRKKIRDQLGDDSGGVIIRPYFGDAAATIVEVADDEKADLIAVGTHQLHGVRRLMHLSVSREVLHLSARNVVCVPVTSRFNAAEAHIPEFRRVLVATDFSELGDSAVPFACAACGVGGLVRVVHVASTEPDRDRAEGNDSGAVRKRLRSLIPYETGVRCQPAEVEILRGRDAATAICAEAERFGADLVCVASHGLGASRALHGSVAKAILKRIRRPLLVVRRPDE